PVWPFRRSRSEVPAPGVSQLRTHSGCRSKRNLSLQRMIVGVSQVCFHDGVADLRIRLNEIFRELLAVPENRSRKTGKKAALRVRLITRRNAGIDGAIDSQRVERVGYRHILSVSQPGLDRTADAARSSQRTQMHGARLQDSLGVYCPNGGARSRARCRQAIRGRRRPCNIESGEHLIEQRRLFATSCRVERVLQAVKQ